MFQFGSGGCFDGTLLIAPSCVLWFALGSDVRGAGEVMALQREELGSFIPVKHGFVPEVHLRSSVRDANLYKDQLKKEKKKKGAFLWSIWSINQKPAPNPKSCIYLAIILPRVMQGSSQCAVQSVWLLAQDAAGASLLLLKIVSFYPVFAHSSCGCCVHWRCLHRSERENQKAAQRFGALSQDLFNWNDFAKFFCLCLKWEKSPEGNKTLKFYHYWRIYMLWILNSGFSTCCSCSEAIQRFFVPHGHREALASSSLTSTAAELCSSWLCTSGEIFISLFPSSVPPAAFPREGPLGLPEPLLAALHICGMPTLEKSSKNFEKQGDSTETNEAENAKWHAMGNLCTSAGASVVLISPFNAFPRRGGEVSNCSLQK